MEIAPGQLPVQLAARQGIEVLNCAMDVVGGAGGIKHVFGNAIPLRNEAGEPAGAVGAYLDVTVQVEQARQLREVKERLSYALDGSNDGFWDWDIPSGHVKFSRRWAHMFGYDLDELEPSIATCERMSHAEDHARAEPTIQACLQGNTDHFETVERIRHKDGRWVWALIRGKVVERKAGGEPVRVTGTFTDVDERKRVEEELKGSQAHFRDLVQGLPVPLLYGNKKQEIVSLNESFTRVLGYSIEDIPTAEEWFRRAYPEEMYRRSITEAWGKLVEKAVAVGGPVGPFESRVTCHDGTVRVMQTSGVLLGENLLVTLVDITAIQKAADALRAAHDENLKLVVELRDALKNVKTLSGMLPICMYCKKIRDDQGYWDRIEHYISSHTDALFSHGMCEECYQKHKDD